MIASEDTRHTGILLKHYAIETPQISYHKFNEASRIQKLISMLKEGKDLAIVTDAGTPAISDPAYLLVRAAIDASVKVIPLPGATAFVPALCASGFDPARFTFYGFLPTKQSDRHECLNEIARSNSISVIYESARRLPKTLEAIYNFCGNRQICIAREISKIHEEFIRCNIQDIMPEFVSMKGEIVLLIAPAEKTEPSEDNVIPKISALIAQGMTNSQIIARISEDNTLPRNRIYNLILRLRKTFNE